MFCRFLAETSTIVVFPTPPVPQKSAIRKLLLDPVDIRVRLIDFVDGHYDRDTCCLRMLNRLDCLRHNTIISCHDQHDDVRYLRTARTHQCERFVTRSVEEYDPPPFARFVWIRNLDRVGSDMLSDAASLTLRYMRLTNGIQQAGLAVIDVSHDSDHRSSHIGVFHGFWSDLEFRLDRHILEGAERDIEAEVPADLLRHIGVERLIDRCHDPSLKEYSNDILRLDLGLLGKLSNRAPFYEANRFELRWDRSNRRRNLARPSDRQPCGLMTFLLVVATGAWPRAMTSLVACVARRNIDTSLRGAGRQNVYFGLRSGCRLRIGPESSLTSTGRFDAGYGDCRNNDWPRLWRCKSDDARRSRYSRRRWRYGWLGRCWRRRHFGLKSLHFFNLSWLGGHLLEFTFDLFLKSSFACRRGGSCLW